MDCINLKYFAKPNIDISKLEKYYIWESEIFPDRSGVYIFYGRNEEILYIGEAEVISNRIAEHIKEGKEGKYRNVKKTREVNAKRQERGLPIVPDKDFSAYKKYFYKVSFFECEYVERKMIEIYLMNFYNPPFNEKDNNSHNKKEAREYESSKLGELMYSVDEEEVLNPAEEEAEKKKIPTEEYIIYYFYSHIVEGSKYIYDKPISYEKFRKSKLEGQLESFLEKNTKGNYQCDKSYFAKNLFEGQDPNDDIDNVFIVTVFSDDIVGIINELHQEI